MVRGLRQVQLVALFQASELTLQREMIELDRIRMLVKNRAVLAVRPQQCELFLHLNEVVFGVLQFFFHFVFDVQPLSPELGKKESVSECRTRRPVI